MFSSETLERLVAPLDPARVKSRDGGHGSLSYIEAHDAIRTANSIFGIGGWSYTVEELTPLGEPEAITNDDRKGFRAAYRAVVKVVVRAGTTVAEFSDVGYGDGQDYSGSYLRVQELAMKEAVSDGVKRALKNFGDQFGLVLYDKAGRKALESKAGLANATPARIKREVMKLAREKTGKDKPSQKEVAAAFDVTPADLAEPDTLREILRQEGLL